VNQSTIACELGSTRAWSTGWLNGLLGLNGRQHAGGQFPALKLPRPGHPDAAGVSNASYS
jgi:hypothetical protein